MLGPLGMQAEVERIPINRMHARFIVPRVAFSHRLDVWILETRVVLDFKIREVFLAYVCNRSQFNVFLFHELLGFCQSPEFGSLGSYVGAASVFAYIPSTGAAKLLRACEDHEQGVLFLFAP